VQLVRLRPRTDLDPDQYLILLREKGEMVRWQPVSPTLMARLVRHGQDRHAPDGGRLLRYADGRPVTSRRYVLRQADAICVLRDGGERANPMLSGAIWL
jgi:hypothetical protein